MDDKIAAQKKLDDSEKSLKKAIHDSNQVLVTASTALALQTVTVTLSRTKLVAEKKSFFSAAIIMSVRVEDLLSVNATIGPVFGSIAIATKLTGSNSPLSIGPFRRKDILKLRRIAHGYIIALQRNIDVDPMPTEELKTLLYELGVDDHSIK